MTNKTEVTISRKGHQDESKIILLEMIAVAIVYPSRFPFNRYLVSARFRVVFL